MRDRVDGTRAEQLGGDPADEAAGAPLRPPFVLAYVADKRRLEMADSRIGFGRGAEPLAGNRIFVGSRGRGGTLAGELRASPPVPVRAFRARR